MSLKNSIKSIIRQFRVALFQARTGKSKPLCIPSLGIVLIVAPHPDDETLGCGGLITRLCAEGHPPHVAILTHGEGSHRGCCDISADQLAHNRHNLTLRSARILGLPIPNIHVLDYKDGSIPATEENGQLATLVADLSPDTIFVPHRGEGWPDHINAAKLAKDKISPEPTSSSHHSSPPSGLPSPLAARFTPLFQTLLNLTKPPPRHRAAKRTRHS